MMSASSEVTLVKVLAIREQPVQHYSKIFVLGAEGQDFVVVFNFKLTFSFLVVEVECCPHRLCGAEL